MISRKRYEIGCQLAYGLSTDTILDDLEWRSSAYFAFFSPNSMALLANYVTVVEDKLIYCLPVPVFHFWPKLTHRAYDLD